MAVNVAPLPKRGIEDAYKSILNRLRRYSGASIADLALKILGDPPKGTGEEIRSAPWLTLLLVKWALQDKLVSLRVGPPIPPVEFDQLRQELWALQGKVSVEQPNVWLMIRTLIHVQFEFQRHETLGFMRWPALYARLKKGTKNRRQFREVMGVEPEAFLDLTTAFFGAVMSKPMPIGPDYLSPLRPAYGPDVDQIYSLFVRDLIGLRHDLQTEGAQRIRGKQELFEFPYLRRFPFLRLRDGRLHCWHPLVFARGIEDAVHLRLSGLGAEYVNEFSLVYEQYVTELANETGQPILDEETYKAKVGGHAPAVEVIFEGEDCNIFVEAKMSLFADDVLLQDSERAIYEKTKRVRDAIKQGWKVGEVIRKPESAFGSRFRVKQDYMLIVTSRQLNIGNGDQLRKLYAPGVFDYPDAGAEQRLPLSHVFILSIEDYERTMGCISAGEISLSAVLKDAVEANQRGETARMYFTDFISKHTKGWAIPAVLKDAQKTSEERLRSALLTADETGN